MFYFIRHGSLALLAGISSLDVAAAFPNVSPSATTAESVITGYNLSMPIDHFNSSDMRRYNNRYWVNDTYWQPGGPIFVYHNGEDGVDANTAYQLMTNESYSNALILAKAYQGIAITWEHRYYGMSQPFPINPATNQSSGGADAYQYLDIEQTLEDVAFFASKFSLPNDASSAEAVHPSKAPWVMIGTSYPGMLTSWARIRNPEVIYAAWASCACVQPSDDGSMWFNPITRALPSNCLADIHGTMNYIDSVWSSNDSDAMSDLENRLYVAMSVASNGIDTPYDLSHANETSLHKFGEFLVSWTSLFQNSGPSVSSDPFCTYLESYNFTELPERPNYTDAYKNSDDYTPQVDGVIAVHGAARALNAYLYALNRLISDSPSEYPLTSGSSSVITDDLAYDWQTIFELGTFGGSSPNYFKTSPNRTVVSRYDTNADARQDIINEFSNIDPSVFPPSPNDSALAKYGGWDMQPSNVMFTEGEFDPWRSLSLLSQEQQIGAPMRNVVQDVPPAGQPPNGTDVYGTIYPGAVHATDVQGGPDLDAGMALFMKALDVWLPAFPACKTRPLL